MRRLVDNHQARVCLAKPGEPIFSVFRPIWRKPQKREPFSRQAGGRQRGHHRAGARNGLDPDARPRGPRRPASPRVRDRPASPRPTPARSIRRPASRVSSAGARWRLVVLMQARRGRRDGVVLKEPRGAAGVLRRDHRNFAEDPQGAQRDILEVADGSGDHIQDAGHVRAGPIVPNVFSRTPCRTSSTSTSRTCTKLIPTNATFDGVHLHDDLLEDLSRQAIDAQIRDLGGFARRLAAIDPGAPDRHRAARAAGARGQHPRPALRARAGPDLGAQPAALRRHRSPPASPDRCCSTTRRWPSGPAACSRSCARCRGSCRRRATTSRIRPASSSRSGSRACAARCGSSTRTCRARSAASTTCTCSAISPTPRPKPSTAIGALHRVSREGPGAAQQGLLPARARAVRAEAPARRGHHARRRPAAGDCDARAAGDAGGVPPRRVAARTAAIRWPRGQRAKAGASAAPASSSPVAQEQLAELQTFISAQRIITLPDGRAGAVAPTPRFYRWTFASMWTPGPVRGAAAARVLLHHRRRPVVAGRAPGRAPARLQLRRALGDLDPRGLPRPLPALPAPAPGRVEAAQVDPVLVDRDGRRLGALLRADDGGRGLPQVRIRRSASASSPKRSIRLCRFIVGIRLHCEDLSVEQGVRFFRDEAFLEEASARREAERGTFDPSYVLYSAGKLMMLKLRDDYKAHAGAKYSLRGVPRHAARQRHGAALAAPGAAARRAERRDARVDRRGGV